MIDDLADLRALKEEIKILVAEAMATQARTDGSPDNPRHTMAVAQLYLYNAILLSVIEDAEWEQVEEALSDCMDFNVSLYRESREKNDRYSACVALARMRSVVRLQKRMADPRRRQLHGRDSYHC